MIAAVTLFVMHNAPGWTHVPVMAALGAIYCLIYAAANPKIYPYWLKCRLPRTVALLLYPVTTAVLFALVADSVITDYYQPVSLFDDVAIAVITAWVLLVSGMTWRSSPMDWMRQENVHHAKPHWITCYNCAPAN